MTSSEPVRAPEPQASAPVESEKAEAPAVKGEMDVHPVTIDGKNFGFVPGPPNRRAKVLAAWCEKKCKGGWKRMDPNGYSWIFMQAADADAFRQAWCSRVNPAAPEAVSEEDDDE